MKYIIFISLIFVNLFGGFEDIETFSADFKQDIINEQNERIKYSGKVYIKKPNLAFWEYRKPIVKQVYLIASEVTIIEPELEQAIITRVDGTIDFLKILNASKKVSKNLYETLVQDQKYLLYMENDLLKRVQFVDKMDNRVDIEFNNQEKNLTLKSDIFKPNIPQDFDIVRE